VEHKLIRVGDALMLAFEEGGKRAQKHCSRLASTRMPLTNHKKLCIMNACAPDSGQTKAKSVPVLPLRTDHTQSTAVVLAVRMPVLPLPGGVRPSLCACAPTPVVAEPHQKTLSARGYSPGKLASGCLCLA